MTEFILLLTLWPFHHKNSVMPIELSTDPSGEGTMWERSQILDSGCAVQGGLWFYAGDDGFIGFSSASCVAAIHNWSVMHIDPVRMSRS